MAIHVDEQTGGMILRPCSVAFMPAQCNSLEGFFWQRSCSFSRALLCRVDILRQQFADTVMLLTSVGQRYISQAEVGFFSIDTVFEIPET